MTHINLHNQILSIDGYITCENGEDIQQLILEILEFSDHIILDISSITGFDIAGVFMLYLLQEKAYAMHKKVIIKGMENPIVQNAFLSIGMKAGASRAEWYCN